MVTPNSSCRPACQLPGPGLRSQHGGSLCRQPRVLQRPGSAGSRLVGLTPYPEQLLTSPTLTPGPALPSSSVSLLPPARPPHLDPSSRHAGPMWVLPNPGEHRPGGITQMAYSHPGRLLAKAHVHLLTHQAFAFPLPWRVPLGMQGLALLRLLAAWPWPLCQEARAGQFWALVTRSFETRLLWNLVLRAFCPRGVPAARTPLPPPPT